MLQSNKITLKFLQELNSSKELLETLNYLVELLENKVDPEPEEIQLVDSAYQFIEKLKFLESVMKEYMKKKQESLPGNKLEKLYQKISHIRGTQSLFD